MPSVGEHSRDPLIGRLRVEYGSFTDRSLRAKYIAKRFGPLLSGKLLDVGCDRAVLKELLPGTEYTGIDVGGSPDLIINLEKVDRLPFGDATFDCVVCADVLEHLDNLHQVFGELVRVSRAHLILSLPNNWANARRAISRGRGSIGHYGLPAHPPADRHKWFFCLTEAAAFIQAQSKDYGLSIRELYAMERPRPALVRMARRCANGSQLRYLNRYAHTLWALLAKGSR